MNPKLMQLLRFTEEDLVWNRKGKMSEKQRKRQMNNAKILLIVLLVFALLLYSSFFLVNEGSIELFRNIIMAVVCSIIALTGVFFYWKTEIGVLKGVAKKITGQITYATSKQGQTLLVVNNLEKFPFPYQQDLLDTKQIYTVYYMKAAMNEILSIEEENLSL
ncbi:MAG: hypothetical protein AAF518_03970 [Spirochaetota bacterium]